MVKRCGLIMKGYEIIKRIIDIAGAIMAIIILSPVFLIIAILVWMKLGKPIMFHQERAGLRGRPFMLHKFRTMTNKKDENGELLPDEKRLTSLGRFLRSTSLDELPELYNVLKGDMSLVGPRPLPTKYLERYSAYQARRHEVKPGLTGWAVVHGRNALTWERKFDFDVWYVDNKSLILDIKIIFKTLPMIFKREGVSSENHVTMEEFMGTEEAQRE